MGLTLDELKEDDKIFETEGFKFILSPSIDKITNSYGSIIIHYLNKSYSKGIKVRLKKAVPC